MRDEVVGDIDIKKKRKENENVATLVPLCLDILLTPEKDEPVPSEGRTKYKNKIK